jgi:hypothetical protein
MAIDKFEVGLRFFEEVANPSFIISHEEAKGMAKKLRELQGRYSLPVWLGPMTYTYKIPDGFSVDMPTRTIRTRKQIRAKLLGL